MDLTARNELEKLVQNGVSYWPRHVDLICVSRRNEWMLRVKEDKNIERDGYGSGLLFSALGRCSSLYRGMSVTEARFYELKGMAPTPS